MGAVLILILTLLFMLAVAIIIILMYSGVIDIPCTLPHKQHGKRPVATTAAPTTPPTTPPTMPPTVAPTVPLSATDVTVAAFTATPAPSLT